MAKTSRAQSAQPRAWLAIVLVIVLPIAALWPVCGHEFVSWDDSKTVADNPSLNPVTLQSVRTWWTTTKMDLYVPVTYTAWGIVALFAGGARTTQAGHLNPMPFHVANLVLHVLSCLAVFQLLRLLVGKTWPAAVGAMVFGVHPVQVEAVAWVSGLKDVLGGLLALVAIWQYLEAVRERRGESGRCAAAWRWKYAIAILAFALAMLAKPNEMVAPLVAGILDVMLIRGSAAAALRSLWPGLVMSAACAVEVLLVQPVSGDFHNVALLLRPLVAIAPVGFYVRKLLWPMNLALDYALRPEAAPRSRWLVPDAVILASAAVILWRVRRSARPMVAGAAVFLVALLPVLGLATFEFQWYSTVADHYLYLPMLGVALMSAWVVRRWWSRATAASAAVVVGMLGMVSFLQTRVWTDSHTLWTHVAAVSPNSGVARYSLSLLALEDGDPALALNLSRQALAVRPDDGWANMYAGVALWQLNHRLEAVVALEKAKDFPPAHEGAIQALAGVLAELGELPEAEAWQREVVAHNPASADQHSKLGWILEQEHHKPAALEEYETALRLDPRDQTALEGRNRLLGRGDRP